MTLLAQQLINGLSAGAVYALIAVGYSLVYGVLEMINFAHGDVYMFSTFLTLSFVLMGWPFVLAVVGGIVSAAIVGILIERFAYRPLRNVSRIAPTVSAVGAALVLENVAQLVWGAEPQPFVSPLPNGVVRLGGLIIPQLQLIILGSTAVLALALSFIVQRTGWGRSMRAIRDDPRTAELVGIDVNRIVATVYALGAGLGAIAGVLFATYYNTVYIAMGFTGTLNAFTAAVIGGIGSLRGCFLGGLLLGVAQSLVVGYVASGYSNAVTFSALILLLVFRPHGIFGTPALRRS